MPAGRAPSEHPGQGPGAREWGGNPAPSSENLPGYDSAPPPRQDVALLYTVSLWRRVRFSRASYRWPPQRKGKSRSRWSRRVIIKLGFSPDQSREINHLPTGWSFDDGQPASPPRRHSHKSDLLKWACSMSPRCPEPVAPVNCKRELELLAYLRPPRPRCGRARGRGAHSSAAAGGAAATRMRGKPLGERPLRSRILGAVLWIDLRCVLHFVRSRAAGGGAPAGGLGSQRCILPHHVNVPTATRCGFSSTSYKPRRPSERAMARGAPRSRQRDAQTAPWPTRPARTRERSQSWPVRLA
jgi:hypothetical protein